MRLPKLEVLLLLLPLAIYIGAFFGYPLILLFSYSLTDESLTKVTVSYVGLHNYFEIFAKSYYLSIIGRTFLYAGLVVGVSLVLGLAYALVVESIGHKLIGTGVKTIIMLPMLLLPVAGGVAWRYFLLERYGWINFLIEMLGGQRYAWMNDTKYAFWWVCLTDIWGWTPFMFLILLAGLRTLPRETFEAGQIDGASGWSLFRHITLPLLKPIIYIASTIKLLDTYKAFDYLWVMTQGGPGSSSTTLNLEGYLVSFWHMNIGFGSAIGVVTMLFPVAMVTAFLIVRRVKGRVSVT